MYNKQNQNQKEVKKKIKTKVYRGTTAASKCKEKKKKKSYGPQLASTKKCFSALEFNFSKEYTTG